MTILNRKLYMAMDDNKGKLEIRPKKKLVILSYSVTHKIVYLYVI